MTRRADVECKNVSAVSLQCGLPHQKSILMCIGYRQWRLMGQPDNTSASIPQQLSSWLAFLEIWEKALSENKEVITALDANLDFLTWRTDDLPTNHRSVKLKSLTDALFERIIGSLISGKELSFATVVHGSESQNHGSGNI